MNSNSPMRETASRPQGEARAYLPLLAGLALLAAIGVMALFFISLGGRSFRVKSGHSAPDVIRAVPEESGDIQAADLNAILRPQNFAERQGFVKPLRLEPPFDPITSVNFKNEDFRIALGGVEGPEADSACRGANDELWACGLEARVALHTLLRGKALRCEGHLPGWKLDLLGKGLVPAACRFGEKDVAVELIRTGFARSVGLADRAKLAAEEEARVAGRGLWRGGWRIVR